MENYKEEIDPEQEETSETDLAACGIKPTEPGGTTPGKWKCIGAAWKWVENIGG